MDRASYVGVPAMFELNAACQLINRAIPTGHCYHVGSSIVKRDYRDVDVRCIMDDDAFVQMFGKPSGSRDDLNPTWALVCISVSHWLALRTGLPIDFQVQGRTHANATYPGQQRSALGMFFGREDE